MFCDRASAFAKQVGRCCLWSIRRTILRRRCLGEHAVFSGNQPAACSTQENVARRGCLAGSDCQYTTGHNCCQVFPL